MRLIGFVVLAIAICATPALADVQVIHFDQPAGVDWNRYFVGAGGGAVIGGLIGVFIYFLKRIIGK
jgi:DNA-binding transcriptional regulator of glucitol operon